MQTTTAGFWFRGSTSKTKSKKSREEEEHDNRRDRLQHAALYLRWKSLVRESCAEFSFKLQAHLSFEENLGKNYVSHHFPNFANTFLRTKSFLLHFHGMLDCSQQLWLGMAQGQIMGSSSTCMEQTTPRHLHSQIINKSYFGNHRLAPFFFF